MDMDMDMDMDMALAAHTTALGLPHPCAPVGARRLVWDPSQWGGVTSLVFVASPVALEESQLWVPEVEMYTATTSTYDLPRKEVCAGHAHWRGARLCRSIRTPHRVGARFATERPQAARRAPLRAHV